MLSQETNSEVKEPPIPRFSVSYMDTTVDPHSDFYTYSTGTWRAKNPVPSDKALWTAFDELHERNLYLLWRIVEEASKDTLTEPRSEKRLVGDFFKSAMNTERIEELAFKPILGEIKRIEQVRRGEDLAQCIAELRLAGVSTFFSAYSVADKKNSAINALYLDQGGISLPDRDYYLADSFKEIREAYREHIGRMFVLAGEKEEEAKRLASVVLRLETDLAKASRPRADLRDEDRNYNRANVGDLNTKFPSTHFPLLFRFLGVESLDYVVIGQPEFFEAMDKLWAEVPIEDIRVYLRWRVLHSYAPILHSAIENENFDFFHRKLLGQQEPEARWKRAVQAIDDLIGEALGKLYVERYFPPEASKRVSIMIDDLKSVFRDRLANLPWMKEETRKQALAKFDKFNTKIGHPARFRDYGSVTIDAGDYAGNVRRAAAFETRRQAKRVGKPVDKSEWYMTPPTVNAYFSPTENEIVFPAGILQPPYFDVSMDDAVNYASIGAVIGHEITHGYDDQGRKFDAEGNLREWWTVEDAKEFQSRAKQVEDLYNSQEALPGVHVNGELTLGESIADFGGVSLAFEALQRRLAKEPEKRKKIDGLTPEQRFFIAWSQIWRENIREQELRRRLTIDPHPPMRYRAILPAINHFAFEEAFPQRSQVKRQERITVW
ncbi:MAG: M13 family metallopeptidase [Nitrososphaerales archaeon]